MKYIFLDRDGVINEPIILNKKPYPPHSKDDLVITASAKEAIKLLQKNHYEIIVVTNQPDVARGTTTEKSVHKINKEISDICGIKYFKVCFHDDSDNCSCRKPKPGMIFKAQKYYNIDLSKSYFVGNSVNDYEAAKAAGVQPIIVNNTELTKKIKQKKIFRNLESFIKSFFKKY